MTKTKMILCGLVAAAALSVSGCATTSDNPDTLLKIQACLDEGGDPHYTINGLMETIEEWRWCDRSGK